LEAGCGGDCSQVSKARPGAPGACAGEGVANQCDSAAEEAGEGGGGKSGVARSDPMAALEVGETPRFRSEM